MDDNKQKNIDKLFVIAERLKQGEKLQITVLSPIKYLIEDKEVTLNYYLYLLERSFNHYQLSQSLSTVQLIKDAKKNELYLSSVKALKSFIQSKREMTGDHKLHHIYKRSQQMFPGWKRVSVNATRRRLEDPDQLLIEQTARYAYKKWWSGSAAYEISQYFCTDYKNYRMKFTKESSIRVNDIAQYFDTNTA